MPEMDGYDLVAEARTISPGIGVATAGSRNLVVAALIQQTDD